MENILQTLIDNRLSMKRQTDIESVSLYRKQCIDLFKQYESDEMHFCLLQSIDNLLLDCDIFFEMNRDQAMNCLDELCCYACILSPWNEDDKYFVFKNEIHGRIECLIKNILISYPV